MKHMRLRHISSPAGHWQDGFTLLELMLVIVCVGILVALVLILRSSA